MATALMVIAPEVFRDEEYAVPKRILEERGADVTTASTRPGMCSGKLGMTATADIAVSDALTRTWDAVLFIGGGGSSVFFDDPSAHKLAAEALERGGILGAICIAPSTLAHAGLLAGKRATAFESQEDDLVAHDALWTGETVTVDGRIVTASGPEAAGEFGATISELLGLRDY